MHLLPRVAPINAWKPIALLRSYELLEPYVGPSIPNAQLNFNLPTGAVFTIQEWWVSLSVSNIVRTLPGAVVNLVPPSLALTEDPSKLSAKARPGTEPLMTLLNFPPPVRHLLQIITIPRVPLTLVTKVDKVLSRFVLLTFAILIVVVPLIRILIVRGSSL